MGNGAADEFESKMSSLIELARDHGDKRSIVKIPEEGLKEFNDSLREIVDTHMGNT